MPFKNEPTEYRIWLCIKQRCLNPKNKSYKRYGARGITICDRWMHSFKNFISDMGERPIGLLRLTIERMNSNGNYEPGNCKWATYEEQNNNTSRNVYLTYNNTKKSVAQWAKHLKVKEGTFRGFLSRRGVEDTFEYFINGCPKSLRKSCGRLKLSYDTFSLILSEIKVGKKRKYITTKYGIGKGTFLKIKNGTYGLERTSIQTKG